MKTLYYPLQGGGALTHVLTCLTYKYFKDLVYGLKNLKNDK